jgi:hypothetical protein
LREQQAARVAAILSSIGASDEMVAAGYLVGLIGNTSVTKDDIEREFGPATAALVRSVAGAQKTYAIGAGRLAFENVEVQTLALAADLATLRGVGEVVPDMRMAMLDTIGFRAARLPRAHLYLQYEVCQELERWRRCITRSSPSRI